MSKGPHKSAVTAFAGPNGSGKTTATRVLTSFGTWVNANDLKNEYGLTDLETAQQEEVLRNTLLDSGVDFSYETVVSTERDCLFLQRAKEHRDQVHCVYVLTNASMSPVSRHAMPREDW